jgi:hypothetical protein
MDPNFTNDKLKIEENIRFHIEMMIMNHGIKGLDSMQSFTVNLVDGAVKSVKIKLK